MAYSLSLGGIQFVHLPLDLIQLDEEFERLLADGAVVVDPIDGRLLRGLIPGVLALALTACQTVQTTEAGAVGVDRKQTMTSLVSSQEVEKQAAQQYAQVLAQAKKKDLLNQNPQQVQRVRAVAARLIPQVAVFRSDAVKWNWEVNVLTSKDINAWCMPGGKIAVYTGLIERLKLSDDELAAVMGHEIAHALREHARERMGRQMATETATVVGAIALEIFTGVRLDPQLAGTFTQAMFVLPNSRENEQEADFIGVELAARGGYDPRAALTLWQKMAQASGGGTPGVAVDPSQQRNAPARPAGLRAEGHAAVREGGQAARGHRRSEPGPRSGATVSGEHEFGTRRVAGRPRQRMRGVAGRFHDQQQCLLLLSAQAAEQEVARVAGIAGQVELRRERAAAGGLYPHMDVRCPARVGDRLDRAEPEVAARVGAIDAVALEGRIALGFGTAVGMVIHGVGIALPDLDDGTGHRLAATIDDATDRKIGTPLLSTRSPSTVSRSASVFVGRSEALRG